MSDISMERLRVISMYDTTEPEYWEHTSEAIRKAVREKVMMARELIRLRELMGDADGSNMQDMCNETKRCRALLDAEKEATK